VGLVGAAIGAGVGFDCCGVGTGGMETGACEICDAVGGFTTSLVGAATAVGGAIMESGPTVCCETFLGTGIILVRDDAGFLSDHPYRRRDTIPVRQSAKNELNNAGTLTSPLPRYVGDPGSPFITRASSGTSKLLVREESNPQIPSARITAATS